MPVKDILNQTFGKLLVIDRAENNKRGLARWICKCDCGNIIICNGADLRTGHTKSCGCEKYKGFEKQRYKHGLCGTRLHKIWWDMQDRCYNKKVPNYKNYGGKGIVICEEWLADFMNFYNWAINNGYKEDLSIDRINVKGNYEPSNCRWVTTKTQSRNKNTNVFITYNGETKCLTDWAAELGIDRKTLSNRLNKGWNIQKVFSFTTQKMKNNEQIEHKLNIKN